MKRADLSVSEQSALTLKHHKTQGTRFFLCLLEAEEFVNQSSHFHFAAGSQRDGVRFLKKKQNNVEMLDEQPQDRAEHCCTF